MEEGVSEPIWGVLWLYIPDYNMQGRMRSIKSIPALNPNRGDSSAAEPFWKEETECAGFYVGKDCKWRTEEMQLITFTPEQCLDKSRKGCEFLVGYARVSIRAAKEEQAILQFTTTIFTCIVLTALFLIFNDDTETIVIIPIKKVVDII